MVDSGDRGIRMAIVKDEALEHFHTILSQQFMKASKQDFIGKLRTKGWDRYLAIGLPSRGHEVFRYLKMRNLYALNPSFEIPEVPSIDVTPFILPECRNSCLIFVNGVFSPSMSAIPSGVVVSSLSDASKAYGTLLSNSWNRSIVEEADPFAALNMVFQQEGAFVYLPPKLKVADPIQVLHFVNGESLGLMPRLQLFAGAHSQAEFRMTYRFENGAKSWVNHVTEMALEENASIKFQQNSEELPSDLWLFEFLRATLKRDAKVQTLQLTQGSQSVRYDYKVDLTGENGEADLNGLWVLEKKNEAHTHVLMNHLAPYCRSNQLFKGVLTDSSQSGFEGKIYVHKEAQKTEAYQRNNNLLLSEGAIANSKPNLEIFADDVKASHGATVGQLDQEQLFYMRTRGISTEAANTLLIQGFCAEVLDLA